MSERQPEPAPVIVEPSSPPQAASSPAPVTPPAAAHLEAAAPSAPATTVTTVPPAPDTAPSAPTSSQQRTLLAGLTGFLAGAALMGGLWGITTADIGEPDTFPLNGTFVLTDLSGISSVGSGCAGSDGYDDIQVGTSVTVYDASGTTVATGHLGRSKLKDVGCQFDLSVPDVPKGSEFYQVEISHRGKVQLTAAEAEAGTFASSLG